jgi:glycosyltransferase involved in cell wall biosynthesis
MKKLEKSKQNILQITPFFSPNIGGVETHLNDLISELAKNEINSYVLTYQPIMSNIKAPHEEIINKRIYIRRIEIFRNLFNKLEAYPIFDFLLLTPVLFIYSVYFMLRNHKKINIIHAHGLSAAFISTFLKLFFRKPILLSTHVTYSFGDNLMSKISKKIIKNFNHIFTLSEASKKELINLGINKNKISIYRHWIDLEKFKPREKKELRKKYKFNSEDFIVLFAARLIDKKGVVPLIEGFNLLNDFKYKLIIAGTGPLEEVVLQNSKLNKNIKYLGGLKPDELKNYLSLSDTLIIPSTHDEGFGRVILEALGSGIPIIGSNRGGIPEAVNSQVSLLIDVNPQNIKNSIIKMEEFIRKIGSKEMEKKCRDFAESKYSPNNCKTILEVILKEAK